MSFDSKALQFFPSSSKSLLDRVEPNPRPILSETQLKADQMVGGFLAQACDAKTLGAMVGAGAAYRFARMGMLGASSPLLAQGGSFLPVLLRAGSYAPALAAESAVFTTLQRGFTPDSGFKNFGRDWALTAISLGSLKAFGALGQNQNGILQHLLASGGFVAGHQAAYRAGLTPKPEGDLLTQFAEAEATNLHLLGGMALAHGLLPGLGAMEKSTDLRLQGLEGKISLPGEATPLFPLLAYAEGRPGGSSQEGRGEDPILGPLNLLMSNHSETGGELDISRLKDLASQGDQAATRQLVQAQKSDPEAARALEEAIATRRERKQLKKTRSASSPNTVSVDAHSEHFPFDFKKLFNFLKQQKVKDSFGLIELSQDEDAGPSVRKSAHHVQTQFSTSEKNLIFLMLESTPTIERSLVAKRSRLTPDEIHSLAEEHVAILTADELAQRGKKMAREALQEYDFRNLAVLAPQEPHAVALLKVLAKYKNGAAQHILQNLETDQLMEIAIQGNQDAVSALAFLAHLKNPKAREALINPAMIQILQSRK